ncbi:pilus assembly protein TadG-related protein [Sandaracinobacteroides sp. A072]|uniref:pilus assembly protein TadG-related protein n=1 Tax=Sandaracinobacteroides sp. A072 TaxID=3461146 RepID=UPI0040434D85
MQASDLIRRLKADQRGAIAVVLAASLPMLMGGVALSVDTIQWSLAKRVMQRQADSGALAGAYGLAQAQDVEMTVTGDLIRNARVTLTEAPVIENAPTAGPFAGDDRAVRVVLRTRMQLPFSRMFLEDGMPISAESTAAVVNNGEYCAISLEDTSTTGISMGGNATVDLRCGMSTNSVAANAVTAGGSSQITATPIAAVGGLQPSGNYVGDTTLIPYTVPQRDPFADLPNPVISGAVQNGNVNSNQTRTLNPGVYKGMNLKGNVTLNPGVYIIDGGELSVGSQARVTGAGVTFVLTSSNIASQPWSAATVKMNGGATLNLAAPSFGPMAGILFYQDRRAAAGNTNKVNGNSSSFLQGAMYFPRGELEFTGTTGMQIDCIQMVAKNLTFSGNSTVKNICPAGSGASSFTGTAVRMVA